MSELEHPDASSSHDPIQSGPTDELSALRAASPIAEREGLPRSYQMRADSHYVDHLESRPTAPAVRLIPTRNLDAPAGSSSVPLLALVQSVETRGILQPLLVRRRGGRYQVIAGRQRLLAAIAAGLTDVPCVIYDVDEAEAAALAEADNLRAPASGGHSEPAPETGWREVLWAVSRDLATIDAAAVLFKRPGGEALSQRVAADLIQAQAWRAAWLSRAALLAGSPDRSSRLKPLVSIIERVKAGFEAQARLTRLHLEYSVAPAAASLAFDEDLGMAAIAGCVFATLAWLADCEEGQAEVRADVPNARTVRVEVVQRIAPHSEEAARYLREPGLPSSLNLMTLLGLSTAQAVAARYGGRVELTAIGPVGSVIRITLGRPDMN